MNQDELLERNLHSARTGKPGKTAMTQPSGYGELHHPELLFFGIDGGVDSYIASEAAAGNLPNFARLLKRACRLTELHPIHPTITPSCWSAITTGATPERNGIIADKFHRSGKLTDVLNAYDGEHLEAERLWEAAARIGKSSLVSGIPVTAPARSPLVRQCGGHSFYRLTRPDSELEFYDIPLQLWFFDKEKKPCGPLQHFHQKPSPVSVIRDGLYLLEMWLDREKGSNYRNIPPFNWQLRSEENGFTLFNGKEEIELLPDCWEKTFFRILPSDAGDLRIPFRFGCYEFEDGFLIISDVSGDLSDVCTPDMYEITKELPPPPLDKAWTFWNSPATAHIAVDSCNHQTDWQIEMMRRALSEKHSDIAVTYFPNTDTVNHFFWQISCGCIPADAQLKKLAEQTYKAIYAAADRYLGFLLDEVADENTFILLVSDHGTLGHVVGNNINKVLHKAGLLQYDAEGNIDCSSTYAASCGCGHIWVNLQGREEGGIVPPEKYEETVYKVINALQDHLRSPEGRSYLAFAVRKEEAGFFGLGGRNCGDVVYGLTAGYGAMTIHAEQIPGARSQFGSMLSLGILAGPGIAEGRVTDVPCRTIDLVPTLCDFLGYPLPEQNCGSSLRRLLEKTPQEKC